MKKNKDILIVMLTMVLFILLAACGNTQEESSAKFDNQSQNKNATQHTNDETSNDGTDNESNHADKSDTKEKIDTTSNESIIDEGSSPSSSEGSLKEEYLKKLSDVKKETEELEATDSSTYALKKVENDRWEAWDALLNDIYGALEEQLPQEEMDQLREKQRNWLEYRDESALEASLKYKGGTQEHLEYVIVLANLTEERCYELVEDYMK
ncbi:DUF1311 domain-containing protein [Aquibacillus koreensis]|uniref:DUF1311 domain-containing protein n=1 Tax=Aquibacillus koreensis TaxID=279446 RepID=A0A9X3WGI1_9BACI|nr:lysozyme inhibitor LprI family protein [Aquibacillus koreensis]MCT2536470.1 DUF1311 domain-containing protein [Aquibacillus koreensis]MDC3419442.1 DUF1311 domain-containing protein [Aquibacillus koreensis]